METGMVLLPEAVGELSGFHGLPPVARTKDQSIETRTPSYRHTSQGRKPVVPDRRLVHAAVSSRMSGPARRCGT